MADGGFPNRNRADNALKIYLDAMREYIGTILKRAHGSDWGRSQLLTDELERRNRTEYERLRLALDAGKAAQQLIDFPDLSRLIDANRKAFAMRNDDIIRVHSIRDLRNELQHSDQQGDCAPDLAAAIVMHCIRTLKRCSLHDAVNRVEQLALVVSTNADATPDVDQRKQREREDWVKTLSADDVPDGLAPSAYQIFVGGLWDEEWERRERERIEIADFGGDIDGLREWFDASRARPSCHEPEYAALQQRERQRLEQEWSEIADLHDRLRGWFDADKGRRQRHKLEYAALVQRQLDQSGEGLDRLHRRFVADATESGSAPGGWDATLERFVPVGAAQNFRRLSTQRAVFTAVSAGDAYSLALHEDGIVLGWGDNSAGQCDAPPGTFTAVSAGVDHSLALREDGIVLGWGDNSAGQCDAPPGTFTAISAGGFHCIGLREDGTVVAWGDNDRGQCEVPSGTFRHISAGYYHSLGLREDGTVVGWGSNRYGQCDAPMGTFIAISAGDGHSLGLREDGTVVGWGDNNAGECDSPTGTGTFVAVSAGDNHSLGLLKDGTVVCWGDNDCGQCDTPAVPLVQ